jgi:transposase
VAKEYPPEVKAEVMAALMAGQSAREIEQKFGVSKTTAAVWSKEAEAFTGVRTLPDTKKEQIQGLLIDLFVAKLKSQISLAEHAGDKVWLKMQDASAVAMLLGVSDDKLIRMLEKYESNGSDAASAED